MNAFTLLGHWRDNNQYSLYVFESDATSNAEVVKHAFANFCEVSGYEADQGETMEENASGFDVVLIHRGLPPEGKDQIFWGDSGLVEQAAKVEVAS